MWPTVAHLHSVESYKQLVEQSHGRPCPLVHHISGLVGTHSSCTERGVNTVAADQVDVEWYSEQTKCRLESHEIVQFCLRALPL